VLDGIRYRREKCEIWESNLAAKRWICSHAEQSVCVRVNYPVSKKQTPVSLHFQITPTILVQCQQILVQGITM